MRPGASFSFDDSLWSLMVVRLSGEPSSQEFERYLARATQYLQRHDRHVCIFDVSKLHLLSTEQRQRQAEWLKTHEMLMRQTLLGIAYVVTSATVRLTLGVIFHFKPPPVPFTLVPHMEAAGTWAAQRLEEARFAVPAALVRSQFGSRLEVGGAP